MARSIEQAWNDFHGWLTPTGSETQAAIDHRASIEVCLTNNFGLSNFFRCGSFGNGTSISVYSDVDYIASIPAANVSSNSYTFLSRVETVLNVRFPRTGVHTNTPAISVPFGAQAESTEVVPARYAAQSSGGYNIYDIADGRGGWMRTCPNAHNSYVKEINDKLGGKVKPLIRFMKAWKYYNKVPISSFFLEMYTAQYADTQDTIIYSLDLTILFSRLSATLTALSDPKGIAGEIYPCASTTDAQITKAALETAARRSLQASDHQNNEEWHSAFIWWNLLFDDRFPSYDNR